MRPDASRLVYRIKTALKGESNGFEAANLAWQYAAEVERSQSALNACIEIEDPLQSYIAAHNGPSVLDTIDALNFDDSEPWRRRCRLLGWKTAPSIDAEPSKTLRERFASIEDLKSSLQNEFRLRAREKKTLEAYQIARIYDEQFGDDPDIKVERGRLESLSVEQLESELSNSLQDLMPAEPPETIIARYQRFGLEIPEKDGPIAAAIAALGEAKLRESTAIVEALVAQSEKAESDADKAELEKAYFECDTQLALDDTRAKLDPALRDKLSAVATQLSHHRASFESNILIRSAIDDLRKVLQGLSISFGKKKATVHDAKERLKSLQTQARKLGRPIPSELQDEIKKALSEANRKRAPKYAILAGATIVALIAIGWFANTQVQNNQYAESLQTATAAINQAAATHDIAQAEQALADWDELIQSAPESHPLADAAQSLHGWIEQQTALLEEYSRIVDRLDEIKSIRGADPHAAEIQTLLDSAQTTRAALDLDPGDAADTRVDQFKSWRQQQITALETQRKQTLLGHMSEAQDQLEQAAASTDPAAFEAQSNALLAAVASARAMISRYPELDANGLQQRSVKRIEDSLKALQEKRDTMAAAQKSIKGADSLADYLKSLEAIYNFDTLPADGKRNIGRVLKLESEYEQLLPSLVFPGNSDGREEFAQAGDIASAKVEVDADEKAFLERLIGDTLFPSIYESKVKYFEGAPVAKSEYSLFLADPIQKGDTAGLKTGINFSFKVRGFDESGQAQEAPLEINFLSHPDGTFWGFFYEPSQLSNESIYYQESLRLSLMRILAGGPRLAPIQLVDELTEKRSLSPAFRAYWQNQLIEFMQINPWKWGLPLVPTLQAQIENVDAIGPGGIDNRQWLSTVEQISPSIQLTDYFREAAKTRLYEEALAFARLYSNALQGEMSLIGQADASGAIDYATPADEADLVWIVNGLTGRIERLEANTQVAPYSPVLVYRFEGQPARRVLQKTRTQTGIDLQSAPFADNLPRLFQARQ